LLRFGICDFGFGIDEGNVIDFILLLIIFYAKLATRNS
jgi:hypothetical protein